MMPTGHGERPDGRQIIDSTTRRYIRGGMDPKTAQKVARDSRLRNEQRDRGDRR